MDVNGTILKSDTTLGLGSDELVLEAMANWVEVSPRRPFDLTWRDVTMPLREMTTLKDLLYALMKKSELPRRDNLHHFLQVDRMLGLIDDLCAGADVRWREQREALKREEFLAEFRRYSEVVEDADSTIT